MGYSSILFGIFLAGVATPGDSPEHSVLEAFKKQILVQEKFLSDTMQHRREAEEFHESVFLPSVTKMIELLGKGECKSCLPEYLTALTHKIQSGDETITEQLAIIVHRHSGDLNQVCSKYPPESLKKLDSIFDLATMTLAYQEKLNISDIAKTISACFPKGLPSDFTPAASPIPSCLLDLCFDKQPLPTESEVQRAFGGRPQKELYSQAGYCYRFEEANGKKSFVNLFFERSGGVSRLINIRLAHAPICGHAHKVVGKRKLTTAEGIGLASSKAEVLRMYGKPRYQRSQPSGSYEEKMYAPLKPSDNNVSYRYMRNPGLDDLEGEIFLKNQEVIGIEIKVLGK